MGEVIDFKTVKETPEQYNLTKEEEDKLIEDFMSKKIDEWAKICETEFPENLFIGYDFLEFSKDSKKKLFKDKDKFLEALGSEICDNCANSFHHWDIRDSIIKAWSTMSEDKSDDYDYGIILRCLDQLLIGHKCIMKYLFDRDIIQYKRTEGGN